jgi:hypothetical protein
LYRFATTKEIKRVSFDDRFSKPDTQVSGFFFGLLDWVNFASIASIAVNPMAWSQT